MKADKAYTLFTKVDDVDRIIGRGVSAVETMTYIVESEPERHSNVACENYETFRCFTWWVPIDEPSGPPMFYATVPLTEDYDADKATALELIAVQFLRFAHHYWDGWAVTDEDFEEWRQDDERHAKSLQDAERIERNIAVKFVEALAVDGYETATDTFENDFALTDPSERDVLVEYFFNHPGMTEYTVSKPGVKDSFRVGFASVPLDFVQSRSGAIEKLLQPIVAPYREDPQIAEAAGSVAEPPSTAPIELPGRR